MVAGAPSNRQDLVHIGRADRQRETNAKNLWNVLQLLLDMRQIKNKGDINQTPPVIHNNNGLIQDNQNNLFNAPSLLKNEYDAFKLDGENDNFDSYSNENDQVDYINVDQPSYQNKGDIKKTPPVIYNNNGLIKDNQNNRLNSPPPLKNEYDKFKVGGKGVNYDSYNNENDQIVYEYDNQPSYQNTDLLNNYSKKRAHTMILDWGKRK